MNVLELMETKSSSFSKTDLRIYESIKKLPYFFATKSITEISEGSSFSKPALTRFAQKLGFGGFSELQYQFSMDLKEIESGETKSYAEQIGTLLKQTEDFLDSYPMDNLVSHFNNARAIYICGASILRSCAEALSLSLQINTSLISIVPNIEDIPKIYHPNDVLFIFSSISGSAYQNQIRDIKKSESKPYMVLVTQNAKHPLRHNFDEVIILPTARIPTESSAPADMHEFLFFNHYFTKKLINK